MIFSKVYDVIVVGGGHAGSEAASSSARMGGKTLLITSNLKTIGQLSCNPAMGGIAKGQIVREIDALGGYSGLVSDYSSIQFRMLNKSKGPAVWSPRSQCDRKLFSYYWRILLENNINLDLFQDTVTSLIIKKDKIQGVKTFLGLKIKSKTVVLTNGTFLNGQIYIGNKKMNGGRIEEKEVRGITEQLSLFGFKYGRMKTGTSPRVDSRSLDYKKMKIQYGDLHPKKFSFFYKTKKLEKQCQCYITYTNQKVHELINEKLIHSPLFSKSIKGIGPRYCPSIEEKIIRFPKKRNHPIFVEPEGWNTIETYVNGFSTSFSEKIQYNILKEIDGFEKVKILKPGYAVEYDYFFPEQLKLTLESKIIENLFFAGQINGTTGYEEAACQGLIAGINAFLKIHHHSPIILKRSESYIGVLIDDLVTKGTNEPYRMFTSRAEYRMSLRQDNADVRLTHIGYDIGLISKDQMKKVEKKKNQVKKLLDFFSRNFFDPKIINPVLRKKKSPEILYEKRIENILSRSEINIEDFIEISFIKDEIQKNNFDKKILEQVSIQIKYKGYLEKEKENARKLLKLEKIKIPNNFNYKKIDSISIEAREKLEYYQPISLSQASRISGISPSDLSILLIYIKKS